MNLVMYYHFVYTLFSNKHNKIYVGSTSFQHKRPSEKPLLFCEKRIYEKVQAMEACLFGKMS